MSCRHCGHALDNIFIDLGCTPPSNAYLTEVELKKPEVKYPLKVFVCKNCWLVQTEDFADPDELFSSNYEYFSSISDSWLKHAKHYVEKMCNKFHLNSQSYVIEVASNDGYLLKNFIALGVPCLGIEPTLKTADASEILGIPVLREFFGSDLAERLVSENKKADLVIGNNVYAHVPDINDFTLGLKKILKPNGVITLEFPHLLRLIHEKQFDTIYHEHFSYLSLHVVSRIFKNAGLKIWDIDRLQTHGGSLRIYGCHINNPRDITKSVQEVFLEEKNNGLEQLATYQGFQTMAAQIKNNLRLYLADQKQARKLVAAYGAAAKGNTLLNYCGIQSDLIQFVCDAAPSKQGKYLPGSHIPIFPPMMLRERKPDIILILPWNLKKEVTAQHGYVREWGGKFITAIPEISVVA
jgi:hypothetical protein